MSLNTFKNTLLVRTFHGSVAQQLTAALVLLGIVATLLTTAVQTYRAYRTEIEQVQSRFENALTVHGPSLAASVWSFSEKQIELELQGLLNTPGFEYVQVTATEGNTWSVGLLNLADTLVYEAPLTHLRNNKEITLGTLKIVTDKGAIYDHILIQALNSLVYFGAWTFILAAAFFWVIRQLITRHLDTLARYTSSISFESKAPELVLEKSTTEPQDSENELQQVATAINNMRSQLAEKISDLQRSELRFRAFYQSSNFAAIVAVNQKGNITLWSAGAEIAFGYTEKEIIGQPLQLLIPERFKQPHEVGFKRALETKKYNIIGKAVELSGVHKDGHEFPMELSLGAWGQDDSIQFSAIIYDISERKKAQQELRESTALVGLLHAIAVAANEAETVEEALNATLHNVCTYSGWPVGHVFMCDSNDPNMLKSTNIWYLEDDVQFSQFKIETQEASFSRGEGLPGLVLQSGEPSWIVDMKRTSHFPRAKVAAQVGLKAAFALPVLAGSEVKGVLEFFSREISEPDQSLFYTLIHIGTQVGRVIERKDAYESNRKLLMAVEQSPASVIIVDLDGRVEYVNSTFTEVTGFTFEDVLQKNGKIFNTEHNAPEVYEDIWKTVTNGDDWRGELLNEKKNGERYWEDVTISPIKDDDGKPSHFLALKEDISIRKQYEEQLVHQANYDTITGLPNRLLAIDRLTQAITQAGRDKKSVAILYVVVDNLNKVSDTLGHAAVDILLKKSGDRLRKCLKESDTVAHFGSGEFVIILPEIEKIIFAELIARKMLLAFENPVGLEAGEIGLGLRIGLTVFPNDGNDPHILFKNAHAASFRASELENQKYRFFTPNMDEEAQVMLRRETLLRTALKNNELSLNYQPVVDGETGELVGAEALIRWNNPELGFVPPDAFIPLAETTGLIVSIGEWVLKEACRQAVEWNFNEGNRLRIAVNVSSRQFESTNLVEVIANTLAETGLPSSCLEIEITERLLINDTPLANIVLHELHNMGVSVSIDDFGTGYSSLSYLKQFPFDTLKVDRAFINDVCHDPDDAALVTAIIAMAHGLGHSVVGEGVEDEEQWQFLRSLNCEMIQGFFFGKPMSSQDFAKQLEGLKAKKFA